MSLGVDDVLRDMAGREELPGATLWPNGALHLADPLPETELALDRLLEARLSHTGVAILELPLISEWFRQFPDTHPSLCARTLVVHIRAPLTLRLLRNRSRGTESIPSANLRAMESIFSPGTWNRLLESSLSAVALDSEVLGESATGQLAASWMMAYLPESSG
jgi:hypothetical protein